MPLFFAHHKPGDDSIQGGSSASPAATGNGTVSRTSSVTGNAGTPELTPPPSLPHRKSSMSSVLSSFVNTMRGFSSNSSTSLSARHPQGVGATNMPGSMDYESEDLPSPSASAPSQRSSSSGTTRLVPATASARTARTGSSGSNGPDGHVTSQTNHAREANVNATSQVPSQVPGQVPSQVPSQAPSQAPSQVPSQANSQANRQVIGQASHQSSGNAGTTTSSTAQEAAQSPRPCATRSNSAATGSSSASVEGRHNRFNPQAYNYSMANSPTMANLVAARGDSPLDADQHACSPLAREVGGVHTTELSSDLETESSEDDLESVPEASSPGGVPAAFVPEQSAEPATAAVPAPLPLHSEADAENLAQGDVPATPTAETAAAAVVTPPESIASVGVESDADDDYEDIRGKADKDGFYSIRLTPFIDHSSSTPYMFFGPIIRKIKPGMTIPVGRYTEKCKSAATAPQGSSAPVVFKSKVVSRQHAQLTVDTDGQWYVRDVKSSSGTFLNHVRLSQANVESGEFPLSDSDILQLGMDYRGGSEEIYRCVKVKVETNYSWRRRGAKFSKEAHERLKELTLTKKESELTPCVICLGTIKPCQAVFVASCSHAWHYRCIRPLIVKSYPQFMCPNCKAVCDIEADLDDDEE